MTGIFCGNRVVGAVLFGLVDLGTYLLGSLLIILLPGPNSLFCLSVSAQQGLKQGYFALLGIMAGDTLLILATIFGAGTLLRLYPSAFLAIKLIGGAYLAYLGLNLLRGAYQMWQQRQQPVPPIESRTMTAPPSHYYNFFRAMTLSLTNPKAILFFLSFFIQFVDPTYTHPLLSFLILAVILQLMSFLYLNLIIVAGVKMTHLFSQYRRLASLGTALVGGLFISFAIKLWTANLI